LTDGFDGFPKGPVAVHATSEEILADTNDHDSFVVGDSDRAGRRIGNRTIYLHPFLKE
jgi:hypothetical protein